MVKAAHTTLTDGLESLQQPPSWHLSSSLLHIQPPANPSLQPAGVIMMTIQGLHRSSWLSSVFLMGGNWGSRSRSRRCWARRDRGRWGGGADTRPVSRSSSRGQEAWCRSQEHRQEHLHQHLKEQEQVLILALNRKMPSTFSVEMPTTRFGQVEL